jgi:sulfite reductase (ferredoxin)
MQSFRTELETTDYTGRRTVVANDIIELEKKIRLFREGSVDEEKFRSLRLARGVYGQRQQGVQMVRIKIPFGRITPDQLIRVADLSDEFASGTLHATTRQDIQIHYVSLDRTPELWQKLEEGQITLREACGNTVRNITASDKAGIDPEEPFDVSPYAYEMFRFFLRNPICQEMGRKFKIAFASSDRDTALTLIHDLGLIPKVRTVDGKEQRGFRVMVAGGLGAQPFLAQVAHEFLPEDELIPFTEAMLRIFDRFGERNRRNKARFKYLFQEWGMEKFLEEVAAERRAIISDKLPEPLNFKEQLPEPKLPTEQDFGKAIISNEIKYDDWRATNVFEQKQKGWFGVHVRVLLGNLTSDRARKFAEAVRPFASDDIRITINQGYMLKFVRETSLPHLFNALDALGLAEPGFDSTADITACPGTDTCNLGISNSTNTAVALEEVVNKEYPELIRERNLKIKISGCMNACGQHSISNIGFHGSSIRHQGNVLPALQVLLGGGALGSGEGTLAEKVIKIPSKRAPQALRNLFDDYDANSADGEYFNAYYQRQGKDYFYQLLKPLADLTEVLRTQEYLDWGMTEGAYSPQIGVGECAGVVIDLVQTLFYEAEEKLDWAEAAFSESRWADAIYHAYTGFVSSAKALLLSEDVACNTQVGILRDFDSTFIATGRIAFSGSFETHVLDMRNHEPTEAYAKEYLRQAQSFHQLVKEFRAEG